jgi:hypothetical protein
MGDSFLDQYFSAYPYDNRAVVRAKIKARFYVTVNDWYFLGDCKIKKVKYFIPVS